MGSTHGPDPANTLANRVNALVTIVDILDADIDIITKRLDALGDAAAATPPAPKYKVGDLIDVHIEGGTWLHGGRVVVKVHNGFYFDFWRDGHAYRRRHDSPFIRHHVEGTP